MATLDDLIKTAFEKQMRQYLSEAQKLVRVTLLEPYPYSNGVVSMRYGSTDARVQGQAQDGEDDEVIDLTRARRRVIPGRPIHYHLSFEDVKDMKCECQAEAFDIEKHITMPLPAAMIWFGSWMKFDKIHGPGEQPDTYDTVGHQRKLVAMQWGGFRKRPRTMANYVANDWKSLESIGVPPMPNVEIVRLDSSFRKLPNSEFRPKDVYNFEKDVVADRWSENPNERVLSFTEAQLREFIAAEMARGNALTGKAARA